MCNWAWVVCAARLELTLDSEVYVVIGSRRALPEVLAPMLATAGRLPADDGRWGFELKWDGMRCCAFLDSGPLRLCSRTAHDITGSYPELAALTEAGGGRQLLLDGEIVAFDGSGRPSFGTLQQRMNTSPARAAGLAGQFPVTYLVFDLLHLEGQPLLDTPYRQRRELLAELELAGPHWATPPAFLDASGADVLAASKSQRLEGIVAKRLDSRYEPGRRSPHWVKVKNVRRQEVVVGGTSPGEGGRTGRIGSLLVGVHTPDGLVYAGRVGTGFSEQTLRMLDRLLAPLLRASCPFHTAVPRGHAAGATWVEPILVVEVAFTEWTTQGFLRHPSYRGLRTDKDPAEVVREQ
jgi:bifunctional non-homologous end joining protein LigD